MSQTSRSVNRSVANPSQSGQSSNRANVDVSPSKRSATHVRTELYNAFEDQKEELVPCGNQAYEFYLESEHHLGLFFKRSQYDQNPIYPELDAASYRSGCRSTLRSVLLRAHRLRGGDSEDTELTNRVNQVSEHLSYGVCVATYLRLRSLLSADPNQRSKFLRKPMVPANFVLPVPFALAVSQLGIIKVSGLQTVTRVCATLSEASAGRFMLPTGTLWDHRAYDRAVEYAKKLGMKFSTFDMTVKNGSTWWLLDNNEDDNIVNLKCRIPEDNFTPETAVIASLFAVTDSGSFVNPIADLTGLGADDYGSMLRNPPPEFNVTCYLVLNDEPEEAWINLM